MHETELNELSIEQPKQTINTIGIKGQNCIKNDTMAVLVLSTI